MDNGEAKRQTPLSPALIVDDDLAMQRRLERLLADIEGESVQVVCAETLAQARGLLAEQAFALALVDIGLPDGDGVELVAWLQHYRPELSALVVSAWGHESTVLAALRAGAIGYLLKERDDIELTMSLRSIQRGGAPIDPVIAKRILASLAGVMPAGPLPETEPEPKTAVHLSERETEILKLVARGYSNREIAQLVSLSRLTIEGYTKTIYRKLAVGSRTAAVFEAQHQGLLR